MNLKAIVICLMLGAGGAAQVSRDAAASSPEIFGTVPKADQKGLRNAVEQFLKLRESGNWEEMYAMWFNERHVTKQEFMKQMNHAARLISFVPTEVKYYTPASAWVVGGCALFKPSPPGREHGVYATLYAHPSSGSWLVSDVAIAVINDRGRTRPCAADTPRVGDK